MPLSVARAPLPHRTGTWDTTEAWRVGHMTEYCPLSGHTTEYCPLSGHLTEYLLSALWPYDIQYCPLSVCHITERTVRPMATSQRELSALWPHHRENCPLYGHITESTVRCLATSQRVLSTLGPHRQVNVQAVRCEPQWMRAKRTRRL